MKEEYTQPADLEWQCFKCGVPLELGPVNLAYLGSHLTTELARCPRCGLVLISEELARGKMAEVEQILEDK